MTWDLKINGSNWRKLARIRNTKEACFSLIWRR
jgi:hypothetical protein